MSTPRRKNCTKPLYYAFFATYSEMRCRREPAGRAYPLPTPIIGLAKQVLRNTLPDSARMPADTSIVLRLSAFDLSESSWNSLSPCALKSFPSGPGAYFFERIVLTQIAFYGKMRLIYGILV